MTTRATSTARVLTDSDASAALMRGMRRMTDLLRPTLGPAGGTVAAAGPTAASPPVVLSSAAAIARRVLGIDDPFADMGAMLVRQLVWSVFETVGDGAATAAVLCEAIITAALPPVAAGASPLLVRRGLERALPVAVAELRALARPVPAAGRERLLGTTLPEPGLAMLLAEVIDTVGSDGAVLIETSRGTRTLAEYTEGVRWDTGYLAHGLMPAGVAEARLAAPRVLVADHRLRAADLLPVIECCLGAGERCLFVIAPAIANDAVALLARNREQGVLTAAIAVKAPGHGEQQAQILTDLALLTGARCLLAAAGDRSAAITLDDLGTARRAWVTRDHFGLIGGGGRRPDVRRRVSEVRAHLTARPPDPSARRTIERRLANLTGAAALILVGAPTIVARDELRGRIEAAVMVARAVARDGGVPGGGAAFLAARPAVRRFAATLDGDEALGATALAAALAAPLRTIVRNSGLEPSVVEIDAGSHDPAAMFDVTRRVWVDAFAAGIVDPLPVLEQALTAAVSIAGMALTTGTLVRRRTPALAITP